MIHIRQMTEGDVPLGMRLKAAAGWNQLVADWRRVLVLEPSGCWVAEWNGEPVGTAAACIFGTVAWIAMVLVDHEHRGRGIGRAMLEHALGFLDERQVATVRLDATPLGQPLYEKLAFAPQFTLARYSGEVSTTAVNDLQIADDYVVAAPQAADFSPMIDFDRQVVKFDRRKLLERLFHDYPDAPRVVRNGEGIAGYATLRPGSRAWQVGPCIGPADVSHCLLADAARRHVGEPLYLDIPQQNHTTCALADRLGLTVERTLVRMCRGVEVCEDLSRLATSSGPELG